MQYKEIIEQLMDQAITEILGEGVYRVSTKTIGSADDLIATLANARSLTAAANQNVGVVGNSIIMGTPVTDRRQIASLNLTCK
jgi:hypothetical protein